MESLRKYFAAWPEVELVQVDSEWVQRLNAILDLLRRLVLGTSVLLGLGVLAVIGNTIRLEIYSRRAEIEVTKLVGGSNAFVRRPFLYTGLFYGLLGATLAALLVCAGHLPAGRPGVAPGHQLRQQLPAAGSRPAGSGHPAGRGHGAGAGRGLAGRRAAPGADRARA